MGRTMPSPNPLILRRAAPSKETIALQPQPRLSLSRIAVINSSQNGGARCPSSMRQLGRLAGAQRRTIGVACGAHILHDGYTDLLYVLLPLWQAEFGARLCRGRADARAVCRRDGRVPGAGGVARRAVRRAADPRARHRAGRDRLSRSPGPAPGFSMLIAALVIGGLGVERAAPDRRASGGAGLSRRALAQRPRQLQFLRRPRQDGVPGGDRLAADADAVARARRWCIGIVGARRGGGDPRGARPARARRRRRPRPTATRPPTPAGSGRGFPLLLSIAMIDSATRMGFLTFLPFLLKLKGADLPMIGVALTLIFAGGAAGKLVCGWLGARLGVVRATWLTEGATAARHPRAAAAAALRRARGAAADRGRAQRHLVGALRHGARAGRRPSGASARSASSTPAGSAPARCRRCSTAPPAISSACR